MNASFNTGPGGLNPENKPWFLFWLGAVQTESKCIYE